MDTAVVKQFLNFFQDYFDLCQSENWPDNDTTETEIRNAFLLSKHIEQCLDKLQNKGVINEFLSVLNSQQDTTGRVLKSCVSEPPKYILKKIINSNTKINQMDVGFKFFLDLFSEDKLENCLTDLMLEAASKETLLNSLSSEVSRDRLLKFKSEVLLCQLSVCNSDILEVISTSCEQSMVELLVVSLLSSEPRYSRAVTSITGALLNILVNKDSKYQTFWSKLFKVNDKYLMEMFVECLDIFTLIVQAVSDCGKLLRQGLSADMFYIVLSELELRDIVRRICSNDCLRSQFFVIMSDYDTDVQYWQNIL